MDLKPNRTQRILAAIVLLMMAALALAACYPVDTGQGGDPSTNADAPAPVYPALPGGTELGAELAASADPFPADPGLWPSIREERIRTLLGPAMERAGVDAWVVLGRENANDPIAPHIGAENAGGLAAFLFFLEEVDAGNPGSGTSGGGAASGGEGAAAVPPRSMGSRTVLRSLALSPETESTALAEVTPLDSVRAVPRGSNMYQEVARELRARNPRRIAVNSSSRNIADGLSWTQRTALERALGTDLAGRLVSSEEVVIEWLAVKLPREVEIMRRAAALTERLELEAYAMIVPGETTDAEVAAFLDMRMAQLGVGEAWSPEQNPNVNSGPDRGHSHSTDKVIMPGDVIQTDFGIRVHDTWVTDIQRFAYVLREGETEAPPEMQERWRHARDGSRAAFNAMRPGATGWDVDRAQRQILERAGSIPIIWGTGHPVGYWAHDLGPALSGAAGGRPPAGGARRELRAGQTFAFDGFYGWPLEPGDGSWVGSAGDTAEDGASGAGAAMGGRATKTISVEEMVVITEDGAEWLIPPQEEWVLVPSR